MDTANTAKPICQERLVFCFDGRWIRDVNRRVTAIERANLINASIEIETAASSLRESIPAVIDAIEAAESAASAARHVTGALALVDAALKTIRQIG